MRLNRFLMAGGAAAALALSAGAATSAGAAAQSSAPVIHEQFTLLACSGKPTTTVQIEGCAEHKVVALDRRIDAVYAALFVKLGRAGRADLIRTNTDWVAYRDEACTTEASIYHGGSVQPVAYANCLVTIDSSHLAEVKTMQTALSPAG